LSGQIGNTFCSTRSFNLFGSHVQYAQLHGAKPELPTILFFKNGKVIDHIKAQGYFVTDHDPSDEERKKYAKLIKVIPANDGYNAQRTAMDLPIIKKVIEAVKTTTKDQVILQPTLGGSLPLFLFEKYLGAKTITVPIANYDNNQHAENENIKLRNLWNGIETMAALMRM